MKRIIYILFILLGYTSLNAQGWYRFYDQFPTSKIEVATQLPNENYIISGISGDNSNQIFLAEIKEGGDIINIKLDYNLRLVSIVSLEHTNDGGLILLGSIMNPTQDLIVIKFDESLEVVWQSILPSLGAQEVPHALLVDPTGEFIIHGGWEKNGKVTPILARLNDTGNILWHNLGHESKTTGSLAFNSYGNIVTTGGAFSDTSKVFIGIYDVHSGLELDMYVYDSNPLEVEEGFEIVKGENGHLFLFSRFFLYDDDFDEILESKLRIREVDGEGNILLQKDMERDLERDEFVGVYRLDDGTFTYCFRSYENATRYYIQIVHLASDLETELWSREYMDISPEVELANDFIRTKDEGYMVSGTIAVGTYIPLMLKVDSEGVAFSNVISGYVIHDTDDACDYDASEQHLSDWMVEIKGDGVVYYRMSDENGFYSMAVDVGNYEVRAVPPSDVWVECAPIQVNFDGYFQAQTIHAPVQSLFDCPVLSVDISTGSLRRCYERNYDVHYCNIGTQNATNVYIEVEIDSQLIITDSTFPIGAQDGNKLTFNIGNLPYNDCGTFRISVFTPCTVTLGDIHCSTAHIYPDAICADAQNWAGAEVKVIGECVNDNSVHFEIQNIGSGNMIAPRLFHIIEDEVVLMTGSFELDAGQIMPINMPASGGVFRLEAEQVPNFPTNSAPSVIVPGCGGFFDSSYMNWYPMDDNEFFYDISCMENVDSYDPNDKQATPIGYGDEHYIEANTDLEYKIRFQNTGTDTAYNVVIMDTLSSHLDLTTFRLGTSSFPCDVETSYSNGKQILKFIFTDIDLMPFIYDEPNSSGYVKFNIAQQKNLPVGTVINNEASIYFDFNDRIVTNKTHHIIGEDFIDVDLIFSGPIEEVPILNVAVTPNPFLESATFTLSEMGIDDTAQFRLFSVDGKLVRLGEFNNDQYILERGNLSYGMYFFTVSLNNGAEYHGKLMVR